MIWKTIRTPSSVSSCPVLVMSSVGATSPDVPVEVPEPSPTPIMPVALIGRFMPVWYAPRRSIAPPA